MCANCTKMGAMAKTKVTVKRDIKTPVNGLLSVVLLTLCFVFVCEIAVVAIKLVVG